MAKLAPLALLLVVVPGVAAADDDRPFGPEPMPVDPWEVPSHSEPDATVEPDATPPDLDVDAEDADVSVEAPGDAPPTTVTPAPRHRCHAGLVWSDGDRWHAWRRYHQPRVAIGFAKSKLDLDDGGDQREKSTLVRLVMGRRFEVELEVAKLHVGDHDGPVAHTGEISLMRVFGRHALHPYVLAGIGGGHVDIAGNDETHVNFAEYGAGLMVRGRHLALGVDLRRGVRSFEDDREPMGIARTSTTPPPELPDHERFTRARITALVYF